MRYFNGPHVMGKDGRVRWALMSSFDIPCEDGELYLRRLRIVQTPFGAIYLHEINLPDEQFDPHDHPFNFLSIILKGGYDEVVGDSGKPWQHQIIARLRFSVHRMMIHEAHKIVNLHRTPTWSLVIVGRRRQEWGFYRPGHGFIPWQNYHNVAGGERRV